MKFQRFRKNEDLTLRKTLNHDHKDVQLTRIYASNNRLLLFNEDHHVDPQKVRSSPMKLADSPLLSHMKKQVTSRKREEVFQNEENTFRKIDRIKFTQSSYSSHSSKQNSPTQQQQQIKSGNDISIVQVYGTQGFKNIDQVESPNKKQYMAFKGESSCPEQQNQYILIEKARYQTIKNKINFLEKQNMELIQENRRILEMQSCHLLSQTPQAPQTAKQNIKPHFRVVPEFLKHKPQRKHPKQQQPAPLPTNFLSSTTQLQQCVNKLKNNLKNYHTYKYIPIQNKTKKNSQKNIKNFKQIFQDETNLCRSEEFIDSPGKLIYTNRC